MASTKTSIVVDDVPVYDHAIVYMRAMLLRESSPDDELSIENLLKFELAPVPKSMFDDDGMMRQTKKSDLMNKMQVPIPPFYDVQKTHDNFIDGGALLWCLPWPVGKPLQMYLDSVRYFVASRLSHVNVYLSFDR